MLMALDVGNTETAFGLYDSGEWVGSWRMRTEPTATSDEWAVRLESLLALDGFSLKRVRALGLASVVPSVTARLNELGRSRLGLEPVLVNADSAGIGIGYKTPQTLGSDRIANAVAAKERLDPPVLVIDFGTATNFDFVSKEGIFEGGLIAPGLLVTGESLFSRTAQLPQVDALKSTREVIARDTIAAITGGLYLGYLGMIEGLIERFIRRVGRELNLIATGGLAPVLTEALFQAGDRPGPQIRIEPNLTLEGVRLVVERNSD